MILWKRNSHPTPPPYSVMGCSQSIAELTFMKGIESKRFHHTINPSLCGEAVAGRRTFIAISHIEKPR
jgi:hypothetical protein